jgi:hypothetical protein
MPTIHVDATAWFDTLKPINPPRFDDQHPNWCTRHYAPAIRLHGDGTGVSLDLAKQIVDLIRPQLPAARPITNGQILEYLRTAGPWCCIAGDDRMYTIWARWLPAT